MRKMKRILFVLILSLSNVVFGQQPVTDLGFAGTSIITDGLILHLDAGNTDSYSGSGNTLSLIHIRRCRRRG